MSRKKEQLAAEDAELFRQAIDGATPLKPTDRINPSPTPKHPAPRQQTSGSEVVDTLSDFGADEEPPAEFMRNGLSRMTLRKLRRGPVQDSLDLHGLRSDDARKLLSEFLQESSQRGLRCVCIIHGKGWHTQGGEGILKVRTRHWLVQHPQVLAFCEAPPRFGGGGAVLVLLKAG